MTESPRAGPGEVDVCGRKDSVDAAINLLAPHHPVDARVVDTRQTIYMLSIGSASIGS